MNMTYEEVAKKAGLDDNTASRYVSYMRKRWADTEEQKCFDGYAEEWAYRFKRRIEYMASDSEGVAVLKVIDEGRR